MNKLRTKVFGLTEFFVAVFLLIFEGSTAVQILEVKVPPHAQSGESVTLSCLVDLEGQTLYSLNWWRNNDQFYQFDPSEGKQQIIYETKGIEVIERESSLREVKLRNVSKETEGDFKCEVVAEYPSFERDSAIAPMEIIQVPSVPPVISLARKRYKIGDHLKANCSAKSTDISPIILWYLNGKKINSKHVEQIYPPKMKDHHHKHHKVHHSEHHKEHSSSEHHPKKHPDSEHHHQKHPDLERHHQKHPDLERHHQKHPNSEHHQPDHFDLEHQRKEHHRRTHHKEHHKRKRSKSHLHEGDHVTSLVYITLRKTDFLPKGKVILTCSAIYSGMYSKSTKIDVTKLEPPSMKPSLRVSNGISKNSKELCINLIMLTFATLRNL